nr:hypothetical protein [Tanacetum cinerariifolium]
MQVQSAPYNGHEIVKINHAPVVMHDSDDTIELAEITKKRMLQKIRSALWVKNKIKIAPPDYLKENYLATFTPQRKLFAEQIFWSFVLKPIPEITVYPPNTPAKLVPRKGKGVSNKGCYLTERIPFFKMVKEHFEGIQMAVMKEIKENFVQMEAKVKQNVVDKKCAEIERKCISRFSFSMRT